MKARDQLRGVVRDVTTTSDLLDFLSLLLFPGGESK
jgi:hypothetical protein